ncbi:11250_t:CDS:1, partial [Gigaspora rosea]
KGNLKRPLYSLVCQWILEVWNNIPAEMIIRSFKKCGISNELDGNEVELIYCSDKEIYKVINNEDLIDESSLSADEL